MRNSTLLAVAFYLSKLGSTSDPRAYSYLEHKNASESFAGSAHILGVPKRRVIYRISCAIVHA